MSSSDFPDKPYKFELPAAVEGPSHHILADTE